MQNFDFHGYVVIVFLQLDNLRIAIGGFSKRYDIHVTMKDKTSVTFKPSLLLTTDKLHAKNRLCT